jgi:hypothetical protein
LLGAGIMVLLPLSFDDAAYASELYRDAKGLAFFGFVCFLFTYLLEGWRRRRAF